MKCTHCNREIPGDSFFCPYCGLVVGNQSKSESADDIRIIGQTPGRQQSRDEQLIAEDDYDELSEELLDQVVREQDAERKKVAKEEAKKKREKAKVRKEDKEKTKILADKQWEKIDKVERREHKDERDKRSKKHSNRYVGLIGMVVLIMALLIIAIWLVFSTMDANERRAKQERLQQAAEEKEAAEKAKQSSATEESDSGDSNTQDDTSDITMSIVSEPEDYGDAYKLAVAEASASSVIKQEGTDNSASKTVDGNEKTSWQEGVDGDGVGESLKLTLQKSYKVKYMSFQLGNWNTAEYYEKNNRPKQLEITVGDVTQIVTFPDGQREYWVELSSPCPAEEIDFVIKSVYEGSEWDDTCIAEIGLYGQNNAD